MLVGAPSGRHSGLVLIIFVSASPTDRFFDDISIQDFNYVIDLGYRSIFPQSRFPLVPRSTNGVSRRTVHGFDFPASHCLSGTTFQKTRFPLVPRSTNGVSRRTVHGFDFPASHCLSGTTFQKTRFPLVPRSTNGVSRRTVLGFDFPASNLPFESSSQKW